LQKSNTVLFHVTSLFLNILMETAWLYDLLLKSYSALNFVRFFSGPPCIYSPRRQSGGC